MVTVADRPARAKTARRLPPIKSQPPIIEEGWQPGGKAAVAVAVAAPTPAGTPVRHGLCSHTIGINGHSYRLRPASAPPPIESVITLSKTDGSGAYALATDGLEIHCTCPDHTEAGSTCKHIMAIVAIARILAPFAATAEGGAL